MSARLLLEPCRSRIVSASFLFNNNHLRHHGLGVLGKLLIQLLIKLLLPLDFLKLLDQDFRELCGAGLSGGLEGNPLGAGDKGGILGQIVLPVLPTLLLYLTRLSTKVLLVVL